MQIASTITFELQAPGLNSTSHDFGAGQVWAAQSSGADFGKNFNEDTGNRRADAVYSNSPMLPRGKRAQNAPVTTQNVPFRTHRRTEGMRNDG